jgi:hypothetical protein
VPFEELRRSFRPLSVKVLFVGESRPASGEFFYKIDSLTRYTAEGLSVTYGVNINSDMDFLNRFKRNGYYLDDLCLSPINNLSAECRRAMRRTSISELTDRLSNYSPKVIISIMMAINPIVEEAIHLSDINNFKFFSLPFPSQHHHNEYRSGLASILQTLINENIIGPTFL